MRQFLRQLSLTVLTSLVFVLGIWGAWYVAQRVPGLLGIVLGSASVAVVLALSFPLLRQWLGEMLNRLLFGEGYDPQRIVHEYSQGISNILDLEVLAPTAVGIISEAMGVHHGTLVVCDGGRRPPERKY